MKKEDVKKLIKKLLNVTGQKGATENEANVAASKVQDLLMKYHFELHDINNEENDNAVIKKSVFTNGRVDWYYTTLASIVGKNYKVSVYKSSLKRQTSIMFVGFDEDVFVAEEVYNFLINTMKNLWKKKKKDEYNTKDRNCYFKGFIFGIRYSLEKNLKENTEKYGLMVVDLHPVVKQYVNTNLKLRNVKSTGIKPKFKEDVFLYSEGYKDGEKSIDNYKNKDKFLDSEKDGN